jgi:23S rRNA (pseudouridine1915-N3)-methyltransferase
VKLLLLAGGRAAAAPETRAAEDYLKRAAAAGKRLGLKGAALTEIDERKANWLDALPKGGVLLALDERGDNLSSVELAALMRRHLDRAVPALALAIGAADGLPPDVKAAAQATIAFGRATWPHMLMRVMAAEQIYRAVTILNDHPYHRV